MVAFRGSSHTRGTQALAKLNPHYFDFTVSSNTSFTMFVLLGFGLKSSMLPDAAWVLAFKAGLWVLEIWEFAIPLFFWYVRSAVTIHLRALTVIDGP